MHSVSSLVSLYLRFLTVFLALESLFFDPAAASATLRWANRRSRTTDNVASTSAPVSVPVSSAVSVSVSLAVPVVSVPVEPTPSIVATAKLSARNTTEDDSSEPSGTAKYCDPAFFDAKNFGESGAGPWYAAWVHSAIEKNSQDWQDRVSEPAYFAEHAVHWPGMDCGVSYRGCHNMPNCNEVLELAGENATHARLMYFVLQSFHNMNLVAGVVSEQSLAAETNVLAMSSSMANTFFWKYDPEQQAHCDLLAGFVKGTIGALIMALLLIVPIVGPFTTPEVVAAVGAAEGAAAGVEAGAVAGAEAGAAVGAETGAAAGTGVGAEYGMDVAQLEAHGYWNAAEALKLARLRLRPTVGEPHYLPNLKTKFEWAWKANVPYNVGKNWNKYVQSPVATAPWNALGSLPGQFYMVPVTEGICKMFPNPSKDAPLVYEQQLSMQIQRAGRGFRMNIDGEMARLNRGSGYGENGAFLPDDTTTLADEIILGTYAGMTRSAHERFVQNPSIIEQEMTNAFKNALISTALKSQMCHLHCTPIDVAEATPWTDPNRFCPDANTICQAQCWQNSGVAHIMPIFGGDELNTANNQWDLSLSDFLEGSYRHWQQYRMKPAEMFPSVDDLLTNELTDTSGCFLPVCMDLHTPPEAISSSNHDVPCTCGDAYGNETAAFLQDAGFDQWSEIKDSREALGHRCFDNMLRTSKATRNPITQYLTFCGEKVHWPVNNDGQTWFFDGADEHCDAVLSAVTELQSRGKDEEYITCKMCFGSPLAIEIEAVQKEFVYYGARQWHQNYRELCRQWARDRNGQEAVCRDELSEKEKASWRDWADDTSKNSADRWDW
ncbi:hypothetical protein MMC34_004362 [Xylographa carneopallida]|nr:hypothetical protein [Xylographa carneopallida]